MFVKQLAQIECREAQLHQIREKHHRQNRVPGEKAEKTPLEHHHIGLSRNQHERIGTFLRKNSGGPAVKAGSFALNVVYNLQNSRSFLRVEIFTEIKAASSLALTTDSEYKFAG